MIKEELIKNIAIKEVKEKNFGTTQQFLEVHKVITENEEPQVLRIDVEKEDGTAIVYFPIEGEKFYLAIYIKTLPDIEVVWVDMSPFISIYFKAQSSSLNLDQLLSFTKLSPTEAWNIGDRRGNTNVRRKSTCLVFEPNPEPDDFDDKLKKLLDFIEQDQDGIRYLIEHFEGYVQVASIFYNGNMILGGYRIHNKLLHRLAALNIEIDFSLYAEGKMFK